MRFSPRLVRRALLLLVCGSILHGCSGSVPGCGDNEVFEVVKKIALRAPSRQVWFPGNPDKLEITLSYVTMIGRDKELDTYSCSANLDLTGAAEGSIPITFDIRPSATSDEFIVQVYGL